MQSPGVRFPPPLIFVAGFLAGWLVERALPLGFPAGGRSPATSAAGWLLIGTGLAVGGWAFATFRRHHTAVFPNRPATSLVTEGPYRFSRNPMYVGLTLVYVGLSLLSGIFWPLIFLPLVLLLLWVAVIRREERYLTEAFGSEYPAYQAGVRRWL
ncbi:MAG: isoprenylcysteine carboxylmethyltransferase family protein [Gemmatimonadaceae bacterium]